MEVCFCGYGGFSVGPVHCSQDPQTSFLTKFSLKIGPMALFTHLKIICYSVFSFYQNKRYPNEPLIGVKIDLVPIWIQLFPHLRLCFFLEVCFCGYGGFSVGPVHYS